MPVVVVEVNPLTQILRNNQRRERHINLECTSYLQRAGRGHRVWNKEGKKQTKRRRLFNQDKRRGTYSDARRQKYGTRRAKRIQDDGLADKLITQAQAQRQRERRKKVSYRTVTHHESYHLALFQRRVSTGTVCARFARENWTWLWANHVPSSHSALIWHPHGHRIRNGHPNVLLFKHVALLPARAPRPSLLLCCHRSGLRKEL